MNVALIIVGKIKKLIAFLTVLSQNKFQGLSICPIKHGVIMKKVLLSFAIIISSFFALPIYATEPTSLTDHQINFEKILSDPEVVKRFELLKNTAENADVYQKDNKTYFSEKDLAQLNKETTDLLQYLTQYDHILPKDYKAHTYVGKNQINSCYQYYNSYAKEDNNKSCAEFPSTFGNCEECNKYIEALRNVPKNHILHAQWWQHESITSYVTPIKLKNGDDAYVGFELSPYKTQQD